MSREEEFVDRLVSRPAPRRRARVEHRRPDPRCPICGQHAGKKATRYVNGVQHHRACLGDQPPDADWPAARGDSR